MSEQPAAPEHAWQGPGWGWTIGFWVFMAVATVRVSTAGDLTAGSRIGALTCVATITLGFLAFRSDRQRPGIDQSTERSELIRQLEATRAELGRVYHSHGVTAERERLAREIHDTLAQGFTSIVMLTQVARSHLEMLEGADVSQVDERLTLIEEVARENLGEARALVAAFGPVGLDDSTLAEAVRRLTGRFGAETRIRTEVTVDGDLTGLTRDREVVLLRATQEALANERRHSAARSVRVGLSGDALDAKTEIVHDGKGFDMHSVDRPLGFGLEAVARAIALRPDVVLMVPQP
ncbi:hypothetical protein KIH74_02770 [Kineosporia sp. J2-2]|uniref:Signal transduction histidine kinase subgroup 3 dimerisation and phosphoacceptor domain-containing protein n=1 Tax=Kineosporia corallincola TaxID=2835133 RepID=A0ABS5TAD5_9ACTN|nr:histidine kinase [Kineosporia corallincola]MBT0767828.1 hypothetical protein [Kineosporia corallincola]